MVKQDQVDVLVDLSGHTARNRMGLFALGPCAVQATWLGYSSTTGIPAMDWFIGDAVTNPLDTEHLHTERVARLPHTFLCDDPSAPPEPADLRERIVFASFNNTAKISPSAVKLWANVLHRIPGSVLKLKYGTFDDPFVRQVFVERFAAEGVLPERIEFCGYQTKEAHEAFFRSVNVCLDTAPYTGATTTVDALRAGVPVVTLAGRRYSSRMSASLLHASGLGDLVCSSAEEFVAKAVDTARNFAGVKAKLAHIQESPVFRPSEFAFDLQNLVDSLWSATP
jgi:predicted O-linked N-acetylglucosamine transferase (SPINDLY family)